MRVSILQSSLQKGLATVVRAIPSKPTIPVLSNVLMVTDGQRIKLSATNLEMGISVWITGRVDEEGAIAIPGKTLVDLVNNLSPERIDMELNSRTNVLNIRCGANTGNIKGVDAAEFPLVPTEEGQKNIKIDGPAFKEMVKHVDFAAAKDDSRPILAGILLRLEGETMIMAAADGFRLAVRDAPLLEPIKEDFRLVIPVKTLSEVAKIMGEQDEKVVISLPEGRNQVMFHLDSVTVVSSLIEGNFPDYEAIIPRSYNTSTQVYTSDLLRACKRSEVFAKDSANAAKLIINPSDKGLGRVMISARSQEKGDNEGLVDASVDGTEVEISFNIRYLIDVLNVIHEDQVILETSGASAPGVVRPYGRNDFIHVIMPMSLGR